MPTLPTTLLVKGSNFPPGWTPFGFNDIVYYYDPKPTPYNSGIVIGGVMSGSVYITLTSAQLLNLQNVAVQLLNAPAAPPKGFGLGVGAVILPTQVSALYVFGGTAYTLGNVNNVLQIEYTGQATSLVSVAANGLLTAGANTLSTTLPVQAGPNIASASAAGLGIEVKLTGTTPALTLGNGTVTLVMTFDIITF